MSEEAKAALDENMPPEEVVNTEAEQVESPAESAPANSNDTAEEVVEDEVDNFQKRINKVTADKYAEKRRADELEQKLAEMQKGAPVQKQVESAPKLEDFDYDEQAFNAANIKYQVGQAKQEIVSEQQEQQDLQRQRTSQASFNSKVSKLTETSPDYAEVVGQLPQLPNDTLNALMESDNGPELAYYLGNHLDIADQIATASPMQAAMQLGRISTQLSGAKPEIKPSAAPDPIKPVDSSGSVSKSQDEMSMEEVYNS